MTHNYWTEGVEFDETPGIMRNDNYVDINNIIVNDWLVDGKWLIVWAWQIQLMIENVKF